MAESSRKLETLQFELSMILLKSWSCSLVVPLMTFSLRLSAVSFPITIELLIIE